MTESNQQASKYVSTGITGLDEILKGGFLRKGFYLLQGDPGSGKTTMALQYLFACSRRGEKGLYITLTETRTDLENTCSSRGWDLNTIQVYDLTQSHAKREPGTRQYRLLPVRDRTGGDYPADIG
jgi:circadian clock protein KaiC